MNIDQYNQLDIFHNLHMQFFLSISKFREGKQKALRERQDKLNSNNKI